MQTTIINLYGGPGIGKSTTAAYLYQRLKVMGKNAELVREYVKDWAWEGRRIGTYDQIYFLGKQVRHETMLYGKVEYIVTDAPILLGNCYVDMFCPEHLADDIKGVAGAVYEQAAIDGHTHIHVMLQRTKPYQVLGRYQTEEQARAIDITIQGLLTDKFGSYLTCNTDETSLDCLLLEITSRIHESLA